jgi:hypothetical protein
MECKRCKAQIDLLRSIKDDNRTPSPDELKDLIPVEGSALCEEHDWERKIGKTGVVYGSNWGNWMGGGNKGNW